MIFAIGFTVVVIAFTCLVFPLTGEPLPGQKKPWSPLTPVVEYMGAEVGKSNDKYPRWLAWITTAMFAPVWAIEWKFRPKKPRQQINCGDKH